MSAPDPEEQARRFAGESLADADPTGWFERLYSAAAEGDAVVPWDRGHAHPLLLEWTEATRPDGRGKRALVVGCGLGDDSELLAGFGFDTVGFDISATAIQTARSRYPGSDVDYRTADLLDPPAGWIQAYDLVFESQTVQSMPPEAHSGAIAQVSRFVAPGGRLLVIALGAGQPLFEGPPWPLRRDEIDAFASDGLSVVRIEELPHPETAGLSRWRAELCRDA
jgi:SAM-dependent methyltransferase